MSAIVVDTNVLVVANDPKGHMSEACRLRCLARLDTVRAGECVVVDDQYFILGEYERNLNLAARQPGPGAAFLKHLLQNMVNPARVARVRLTPTNAAQTDFAEFPPDDELQLAFDPSDRKFVAASHTHPERPPILQAADSKWLTWEARLQSHGIHVEFLCRSELAPIHQRKHARP